MRRATPSAALSHEAISYESVRKLCPRDAYTELPCTGDRDYQTAKIQFGLAIIKW